MNANLLSIRFCNCIKQLKKENKIKSYRQFALSIDFSPQNLSKIINGKRDPTIELIHKAAQKYQINPNFIFGLSDQLYFNDESENKGGLRLSDIDIVDMENSKNYADFLIGNSIEFVTDQFKYNTVDNKNDAKIFLVDTEMYFPMISRADLILTKRVKKDRWFKLLRDHHMYVIVDQYGVRIHKILNSIKTENGVSLYIDADNRTEFMSVDNILEIWEITHIIKRWVENSEQSIQTIKQKLHKIDDHMGHQVNEIKSLNMTLQKFLKYQRMS